MYSSFKTIFDHFINIKNRYMKDLCCIQGMWEIRVIPLCPISDFRGKFKQQQTDSAQYNGSNVSILFQNLITLFGCIWLATL